MGIPLENIKKLTNLTYEDFDEVYKGTYKTLKKNALKDKRSFLMVYCAGHGVGDMTQDFVLNQEEKILLPIEKRLRLIAQLTNTSVLAFYDVCRQDKASIPNITRGEVEEQKGFDAFADTYNYMHIGTHPHGVVDADSKLATMITEQLTNKSLETDDGLIEIPGSFTGMQGGVEKTDTGESYILAWKKQEEKKDDRKRVNDLRMNVSTSSKQGLALEMH